MSLSICSRGGGGAGIGENYFKKRPTHLESSVPPKSLPYLCKVICKNDEISPHFLLGKFWGNGHFSHMEISVSLKFAIETCPFPLNFHPRTMGKFWYFCYDLCLQNLPPKSYCCVGEKGKPPRRWEGNESALSLSPSQRSLFCFLMRKRLGQVHR